MLTSPLDVLELGDFGIAELREMYLAEYGVMLWAPMEHERRQNYTMTWEHGFVESTPVDWGKVPAEVMAFTFVWHWLRGSGFEVACDLAHAAAYEVYKSKSYRMYGSRHG